MKIIYPIERDVDPKEMMQRAEDAWANGEIGERPEDPYHAAELLQEAGQITLEA